MPGSATRASARGRRPQGRRTRRTEGSITMKVTPSAMKITLETAVVKWRPMGPIWISRPRSTLRPPGPARSQTSASTRSGRAMPAASSVSSAAAGTAPPALAAIVSTPPRVGPEQNPPMPQMSPRLYEATADSPPMRPCGREEPGTAKPPETSWKKPSATRMSRRRAPGRFCQCAHIGRV